MARGNKKGVSKGNFSGNLPVHCATNSGLGEKIKNQRPKLTGVITKNTANPDGGGRGVIKKRRGMGEKTKAHLVYETAAAVREWINSPFRCGGKWKGTLKKNRACEERVCDTQFRRR